MAHFAHITNGIVDHVIVISQETLEQAGGWPINGVFLPKEEWVQTSYNTSSGEYKRSLIEKDSGTDEDRKARTRKNYAGIGYSYDKVRDAFIPPKPFASWALDEKTCTYKAQKEYPKDGKRYEWNEELLDWVILEK